MTDEFLQKALDAVITASDYREIYRAYNISVINFPGNNIASHLKNCSDVIFAVLTLGSGVDALIRREQLRNLPFALMLDMAASNLIEERHKRFQKKLREEFLCKGLYITSAYSPGYGDLPLEFQRELLRLSEAEKIGVWLGESLLMSPRKSISSIIGVSDIPVTGALSGCEGCNRKHSCDKRRMGDIC